MAHRASHDIPPRPRGISRQANLGRVGRHSGKAGLPEGRRWRWPGYTELRRRTTQFKIVRVRPRGSDLMQIRRAEAADEEALASIRRRAILGLAVPAMSREQAEGWAARGAADRVARAMREHDVWVAVEGAAIGWVEVDRDRVAALYVSPSCSRRGVGSVLLTFAETSIRNSGYTTARLESSQNALDYYLRRGYLRCGPADSDGAWPLRKDLAAVTPKQGMEPTR
jgi:GNAT superfamily N-acetyltransferase